MEYKPPVAHRPCEQRHRGRLASQALWNTVTIDGQLPDGMMHEMIEDSCDLVKPKREEG